MPLEQFQFGDFRVWPESLSEQTHTLTEMR